MSYFYRSSACKALSLATVFLSALRYLNLALPSSLLAPFPSKLLATLTPAHPYFILPLLVLWKYRIVERRLGTCQFIQLIFFGTLISLLITRVTHLALAPAEKEPIHILLSLICVLYPVFLAELPLQPDIVSFLVSENALVTFLLIQTVLIEANSARAALTSIIVGAIIEQSWSSLNSYLTFPKKLKEFGELIFKWFPDKTPPRLPLSGATLEVQRSQLMDNLEARGRGQGFPNFPIPQARVRPRFRPPVPNTDALPPQVSEEKIQQLCDMGFNRENAMIALTHSGGEVELAAAILIAEKS